MTDHINRVFVDGKYLYSGLAKKDLEATKKDFRQHAVKRREETDADHAVYCLIEYTEDGEIESARFYSDLTMDDATFDERTAGVSGYIGAVHKHK